MDMKSAIFVFYVISLMSCFPVKDEEISEETLREMISKVIQTAMEPQYVSRPKGLSDKEFAFYNAFFHQVREMSMYGRKERRPTYKELCCIHTWPPENYESMRTSNKSKRVTNVHFF